MALQDLQGHVSETGVPLRVLGFGSNVVISQASSEFLFLRLGKEFSGYQFLPDDIELDRRLLERNPEPATSARDSERILVRGGTSLMSLSRELSRLGFSGLEFAAGIPASVGGAVIMNAGAHGGAMSDVVEEVYVVTRTGQLATLAAKDLKFSYRHSELPLGCIVVGARLCLERGDPETIQRVRAEFLEHRRRTQPLHLPSVGSVFKNIHEDVVVHYAGKLLDEVGLRGFTIGGAQFSDLHANWIVRCREDGRIEDVISLITLGREKVLSVLGKTLEPEVHLW